MGKVVKLEQPKEPLLLLERSAVLAAIPTNWLDSLLTGPNKVLPSSHAYTNPDIERLLRAIKARLEALGTLEPCDVCGGVVDSTADACRHCG